MDDRPGCCSGFGCVVVLVLALCALGYYIYANHQITLVYQSHSTEETMDAVKRSKEGGRPVRFAPHF